MSKMQVEDHLDLEKVMKRQTEELLKIARLQGEWTAAMSFKHQGELLGSYDTLMGQIAVHIESVEKRLADLGAVEPVSPPPTRTKA